MPEGTDDGKSFTIVSYKKKAPSTALARSTRASLLMIIRSLIMLSLRNGGKSLPSQTPKFFAQATFEPFPKRWV